MPPAARLASPGTASRRAARCRLAETVAADLVGRAVGILLARRWADTSHRRTLRRRDSRCCDNTPGRRRCNSLCRPDSGRRRGHRWSPRRSTRCSNCHPACTPSGRAERRSDSNWWRLLQPLLLIVPSGLTVRQKMAPEVCVVPLMTAPRRLASTRHAPLSWAPVKLAPRPSILRKFVLLSCVPVKFALRKAVELAKSQPVTLRPRAKTQLLPGKHFTACARTFRGLPLASSLAAFGLGIRAEAEQRRAQQRAQRAAPRPLCRRVSARSHRTALDPSSTLPICLETEPDPGARHRASGIAIPRHYSIRANGFREYPLAALSAPGRPKAGRMDSHDE